MKKQPTLNKQKEIKKLSNSDYILALGKSGIIPGPMESQSDFKNRLALITMVKEKNFLKQSANDKRETNRNLLHNSCILHYDFDHLLGVSPNWIPLAHSNKGLLPWHGAIMWVCCNDKMPLIQMREKYNTSGSEPLLHEVIHSVRLMFYPSKFEEILAYSTSKSWIRRTLGGIFRSPREELWFLIALLISSSLQITAAVVEMPSLIFSALIPAGYISYQGYALARDKKIFNKTINKLRKIFRCNPIKVAIRLSDEEIIRFSKESENSTVDYIQKLSQLSLRWKQIILQFGAPATNQSKDS